MNEYEIIMSEIRLILEWRNMRGRIADGKTHEESVAYHNALLDQAWSHYCDVTFQLANVGKLKALCS